jgi:clan AA aspartic protease (TIGR02281 family)
MSDAYGPSGGAMLRRAFLWTIGLGGVAYTVPRYVTGLGVGDLFAGAPSTPAPARAAAPRADAASDADAPAIESFRAHGGQFFVTGTIDGNPVPFVVDTGATYVSLAPEDARRLGFDLAALDWRIKTHTANGDSFDAAVNLADLRLGSIVQYNVPALVMKTGGGMSLLGMSFLSRLKSWQIHNGVLTIAA